MNSEAVVWVLASHQGEVFRNNCAPGFQVLRKTIGRTVSLVLDGKWANAMHSVKIARRLFGD